MFKKFMVGVVSSAIIMSSLPLQAASLGQKSTASRSSSGSSMSRSAPPSRGSSFNAPTRQSGSSFGTPTRPTAPPSSAGGISQGSSVGMTRGDVSSRVRNGTNVAPANETTAAGRNPGAVASRPNTSGTNSGGYNNNGNYNNGGYNNNGNYNNGGYGQPQRQGYGTGAMLGAAAAGAVGGYLLNGIMHDKSGAPMNGYGYQNGVPVPNAGVANSGAATTGATPNDPFGAGVPSSNSLSNNAGANNVTPMAVAPAKSSGMGFWGGLLMFLLVIIALVVLYRMFFGSKKSTGGASMFNTKSPEAELRDTKEQLFIDFQKNNRPSGLGYIQQNSDPMLFESIRDSVSSNSDSRSVTVKSLEAKLEDITKDGSRFIASVSYRGVLVEQEEGQDAVTTNMNELWNFVHNGTGWKLAGIEQL